MPMGQLTPKQRANSIAGLRGYWKKMTPEQRTIEMRRRFQVARQRREAGLPPVNMSAAARAAHKKRMKPSTESPFPAGLVTNRTTIRDRMLAIEVAVAALKADLGI